MATQQITSEFSKSSIIMGTQQITSDDKIREICMQAAVYAQIFHRIPLEIVRDVWIPSIKLQDLRNRKKLCLVMDLDNTLLHTKRENKFSPEEKILVSQMDDISRWDANGVKFVTKLRPFVQKFLQEASKLFDLYIYTNGSRYYAKRVVGLLDPDGVYFGSRIISREDSTIQGQKGLDVVPVHKSGVLILDDTEEVWARDLNNLVLIERYVYFAPDNEGMEESESSGPLSCALRLLEEVHRLYFEFNHMFDAKQILGILLENNGIHEEKLQELLIAGNSGSDSGSRKRFRVGDKCPSVDVTKRQRC